GGGGRGGVGKAGTAEHVERIVRGWRRLDRLAEAHETAKCHRNRALHMSHDEDGMVVIRVRLEPEAGAVFMKVLEAGREALYRRRQPTDVPAGASYVDGSPEAPPIAHP